MLWPALMPVLAHYVLITMWSCPSVLYTCQTTETNKILALFSLLSPRSLLWSCFFSGVNIFVPLVFPYPLKSVTIVSEISKSLLTFVNPHTAGMIVISYTEVIIIFSHPLCD